MLSLNSGGALKGRGCLVDDEGYPLISKKLLAALTAGHQAGDTALSDDSPEIGNGKTRKRVAAKTPARQSVTKVKSTIHLSVEASQRLDIHATMMGLDRSALVEKLINDHLRRYVVSDRGRTEDANDATAA